VFKSRVTLSLKAQPHSTKHYCGNVIFLVVEPCNLVEGNQYFGRISCLHLKTDLPCWNWRL